MLTPKDTPVEVIRRLSGQIAEALKSSEFSSQLIRRGFVPLGSTRDVMDSHLSQEVAKWAKVIEASRTRVK